MPAWEANTRSEDKKYKNKENRKTNKVCTSVPDNTMKRRSPKKKMRQIHMHISYGDEILNTGDHPKWFG